MFLVGMTDKALFHRHGVLVVKDDTGENYVAVEDKITQIDSDIEDKESEIAITKDKNLKEGLRSLIKDLEKQKKDIVKDAKKRIDLSHKILVFLDTPRPELFNALMPLLSHDKYEVEYEYVDTHNGIKTRTNILRGWPAVVFAQAIDYSHYARWPEIQRRFIITNPKMDKEKYEDAIDLIGDKFGLPDFAYQGKVVSDIEKEQVREVIQDLKKKMLDVTDKTKPGKNNVIIPFNEALTKSLPREKAFDMTTANRFFGFLSLLPVINVDRRPRIVFRKKGTPIAQLSPFALFEDLQESIFLMEYANGVRPYVIEWYYDVFLKAYEAKTEPDFKVNSRGETIIEKRKAVTTEQLIEKTKGVYKRNHTTKQILDGYIYPLINQGYIDKTDSELDKRSNIYYPVVTSKYIKLFENEKSNNLLQHIKVLVANPALYPTKQYLISKIQLVLKYSETNDFFIRIEDHEGNELTVEELVSQYYQNPNDYFDLEDKSNDTPPDDSLDNFSSPGSWVVNKEDQEKNKFAREGSRAEYLKSNRITSKLQQKSVLHVNSTQLEANLSKELFEYQKSNNFLYSCYYCYNCQTNGESDYERHLILKHPDRPTYPTKSKKYRIEEQGELREV
jgi:hypothetical protein